MKMDKYIKDIGNFVWREQESLLEAQEKLQEMIKSCPRQAIIQQTPVHIFYGEV